MKQLILCLALVYLLPALQADPDFTGRWELAREQSTPIDPWRSLVLDLEVLDGEVMIRRTWGGTHSDTGVDSMRITTDGLPNWKPFQQWVDNRHLGVRVTPGATRQVVAQWKDNGRTLGVEQRMTVLTSQGEAPVRIYSEYRLAPDGRMLHLMELRSTRPRPLYYVFTRTDPKS